MDKVLIQYRIQENTEVGQFNDAIYYTIDEWFSIHPEEVQAKRKQRVDNWVNFVKNPPELTKEQLQAQKDELNEQIVQWQSPSFVQDQIGVLQEKVSKIQDKITEIGTIEDIAIEG